MSAAGKNIPQSVLIVRLGAIGDVLMMLPAVHELHRRGARVDWICGKVVAPLLAMYPWVNVIVVDDVALYKGGAGAKARELLRLWRRLRFARYDLVATLQYDRRYRLLTRWVRAARRVQLARENRCGILQGRGHANEYARLLGLEDDGFRTRNWTPLRPENVSLLAALAPVAEGKRGRIALVPAGAKNVLRESALRRWPVTNYVALADALMRAGYEVLMTGNSDDAWVREHFTALPVQDWIGRTSLPELLALYDSCDAVVTHDTGSMHVAGISRAALLALFGPTDPGDFLPRRPRVKALWGGARLPCRPCYDGRDFAPCERNGCMEELTVEQVLRAVMMLCDGAAEEFLIINVHS